MKPQSSSPSIAFTPYQKKVVAILAFLQFTVILDFMILSPLGAFLMPALNISPAQFGAVVSIYAFSAGISGLLAAGFADRYDRKKLLLFFYCGFILGTLFCAIAPSYGFLLFARMVTGIFGGVVGSCSGAIVTDLFPLEIRGRVMGIIQTAFASSQVLGLPAGLYLSNLWGWHAPFYLIVLAGVLAGFVIFSVLQPVDAHLKLKIDHSPFHHFKTTLTNPQYFPAFGATAFLSIGGFMIMPFSSAFTVNNVGIATDKLPIIYLITGIFSIFMGPLIGRISDQYGKYNTFVIGSLLSVIMVLIYTNLGVTPLGLVILVNVMMFVGIFSRMIPSQALVSAIPEPANRGAFMSVSSSLQQIAGGIASVIGGMLITTGPTGALVGFERVGYVMTLTSSISVGLMYLIHLRVKEKTF